jgi:hypothetical protein
MATEATAAARALFCAGRSLVKDIENLFLCPAPSTVTTIFFVKLSIRRTS